MKGRKGFAFSGIARNNDFFKTVESFQCQLTGCLEFADHHSYSEKDLNMILRMAEKEKAEILITTEKDYVRIAQRINWPYDLFVIGIKISFGNDDARFFDYIKKQIAGK